MEKELNLSNWGVSELPKFDQEEIDGGFWVEVAIGVAIGAAVEIMGDWDNFKAGLSGRCSK